MIPTPTALPPPCGWCQQPETVGGLVLALVGVILLASLFVQPPKGW